MQYAEAHIMNNSVTILKSPEKTEFKRNLLLCHIRREGRISRRALARKLGLGNSRVCEIVQEMLDDGLLIEDAAGQERRGRRGVPIMVNPTYGHMVGFDMEAARLRLLAVDFAGNVVWQKERRFSPANSRRALVNRLTNFIHDGLAHIQGNFTNVLGVGLAGPGTIDIQKGMISRCELLDAATVPIREIVATQTELPVVLVDNIRAFTLAEWTAGAAQHLNSFICLARILHESA